MKRPEPLVSLLWRQVAVNARRRRHIRLLERKNSILEQRLEAACLQRDRARDDVELVLRMCPDKRLALDILRDAHEIARLDEVQP